MLAVKLLHVCFQEPQRERPSAKEHNELPENCSIGLLALVKNLYLSGKFQFPATGSCACTCQMKELSNNQRLLCSIIYTAAATHGPSPEPVALGKHQLQTPARHRASPSPVPRASRSRAGQVTVAAQGEQRAQSSSPQHRSYGDAPAPRSPYSRETNPPRAVQSEQIGSADTRDPVAQPSGVAGRSPPMHSPGILPAGSVPPLSAGARLLAPPAPARPQPSQGNHAAARARRRQAGSPCQRGHGSAPEGSYKSESLRLVFSRRLSVSCSHQSHVQPGRDAPGQGAMPGQVPGSPGSCSPHPIPQVPASLSATASYLLSILLECPEHPPVMDLLCKSFL